MITNKRSISNRRKLFVLVLHTIIGVTVFYFIFHPLAMTVYAGDSTDSFTKGLEGQILFQIKNAFSFRMLPMAYVFIISGGIVGLLSGFNWLSLARRRHEILRPSKDIKDVNQLVAGGENHYVEFKSSVRYDFRLKTTNRVLEEVIAKTIAGFMNSEGGCLLIGVSDNAVILGIESDFLTLKHQNEDGFERMIFDLVASRLGAEFSHLCDVSFHRMKEKSICTIHILPSSELVYFKNANQTEFYIRIGNSTRKLSIRETVKYLKLKEKGNAS